VNKLFHFSDFLYRLNYESFYSGQIRLSIFIYDEFGRYFLNDAFIIFLDELNNLVGGIEKLFVKESVEKFVPLYALCLNCIDSFIRRYLFETVLDELS
jgi:hypothetical protein